MMYHSVYAWYLARTQAEDEPEGTPSRAGEASRRPGRDCATAAGQETASPRNPLVGTWQLVSCECTDGEGGYSQRYHRDGAGAVRYYVRYRDNGAMCLVSTRANRPAVPWVDGVGIGGSPIEQVGTAEIYLSAYGTYELRGDTIVHRLGSRCFPAWLGADRAYLVERNGDRLAWVAPAPRPGGPGQATRLLWERA